MKLHSPEFERRLSRRVSDALRMNPDLRRQAKRAPRQNSLRTLLGVGIRMVISAVLGSVVLAFGEGNRPGSAQAAIGAIWFLGFAFVLRFHILNAFYRLDYLAAFTVLPVPFDLAWRWNRLKSFRIAWRTGLDAVVVLGAIALANDATAAGWLLVVPAAVLVVLLVHALALWLTFVPVPAFMNLLPSFAIIAFVVVMNATAWRDWLMQLVIQESETLSMALPAGWVLRPFVALVTWTRLDLAVLLLPALGLAASQVWALRRFAASYAPFEFALWQAFAVPPAEFKDHVNALLAEQPSPPGPTETMEVLQAREFLAPGFSAEPGQWIERAVLAALTPRQHAVLELAMFELPRWTRRALAGAGLLLAAIAAAAIGHRAGASPLQTWTAWTAVVSGVAGMLLALPLGAGFKRIFHPIDVGGLTIPFGAVFPVTLMELVRLAVKVNLFRAGFILPLLVGGGALLGIALEIPVAQAAGGGLKLGVLSIAFTPMLVIASLSSVTNDTSRVSCRGLFLILIFLGSFLGFLGLGAASLFAPFPWSMGFLAAAAVTSLALVKLYAALDARRWFDLFVRPKDHAY